MRTIFNANLMLSASNTRRSIREKRPNSDLIKRRSILNNISTPTRKSIVSKKERSVKQEIHINCAPDIDQSDDENIIKKEPLDTTIQHEDNQSSIKEEPNNSMDNSELVRMPENFGEKLNIIDWPLLQKVIRFFKIDLVVTKNAGILPSMEKPVQPFYFPTEAQNSGIILFSSSSRKAVLKISYPKVMRLMFFSSLSFSFPLSFECYHFLPNQCFVILSGKFVVEEQGIFNVGDFIKVPAGRNSFIILQWWTHPIYCFIMYSGSKIGIQYLGGSEGCGKVIFFKSQS